MLLYCLFEVWNYAILVNGVNFRKKNLFDILFKFCETFCNSYVVFNVDFFVINWTTFFETSLMLWYLGDKIFTMISLHILFNNPKTSVGFLKKLLRITGHLSKYYIYFVVTKRYIVRYDLQNLRSITIYVLWS